MVAVTMRWRAWYGDELLHLSFPEEWRVRSFALADAPRLDRSAIERAMDRPIDAPPLEVLARGRQWVSIAVDDISRPAPAAQLLPPILSRLERAGVNLDRVRIVLGTGTHRPMVKADIVKKIGAAAAYRLEVYNNHPWGNQVHLGTSGRGTPVYVARPFAEADLKIGVGSITPHGGPGFGGGAKVVVPGVAGIETIAAIHRPGRLRTALLEVDANELRQEIEAIVREQVGLDFIVNAVVNARREIAAVVAGDMVSAHRAGVELARALYATDMPDEPVDVAICNAYPKDTDFLQNGMALNVLRSASRPVVKPGGVVVIVTASPEGRGYHGLYGPGMPYDPLRGTEEGGSPPSPWPGAEVVYFSPAVSALDARGAHVFQRWDDLVAYLIGRYGRRCDVAVFPCGSLQIAREAADDS
ncbi:MAG: hypothetical protein Kow0047_30360 [Anaerolineae bacterium]